MAKSSKNKKMTEAKQAKLTKWQERFRQAKSDYSDELNEMNVRERYYNGSKDIYDNNGQIARKSAANTRNIIFEMIEAQVEATFPTPKVTPREEKDEMLAKTIEDMLNNEMNRLPSERINDMDERTVTIQGGDFFLVEWDSSKRTHTSVGELALQVLHPKKIIPQTGVETLEQSDWVFVELAQTKEYIKRRYGVDVSEEGENDAEIRGEHARPSENMVTQVVVYYRNEEGGIGLFSYVNDIVLEDLYDYQARVQKYCEACGASVSATEEKCPYCGHIGLKDDLRDYFELEEDIVIYDKDGNEKKRIPAMTPELDEFGNELQDPVLDATGTPVLDMGIGPDGSPMFNPRMQPRMKKTQIPYYKPNVFPLIMRKNVSVDGKWLGNSDVDFIKDQQNETNMYVTKVSEKTKKGGSLVTLHDDTKMETTDEEMKIVRIHDPNEKSLIGVYNLQPDCSMDLEMIERQYNYARQTIGITDSYQGRTDNTALSGAAKQFSANQAAGRFESKKVMKRAAYAELYEVMFKFMLAYADEERPFRSTDRLGNDVYETFNKYEFLEQDAAGEWYWNDRFMFSCESGNNLTNNREALWEEAVKYLQYGAFGDPMSVDTRISFWTMMEGLHHPLATTIKRHNEVQKQQEMAMAQQQAMMQQQMAQQAQAQQQMAAVAPPPNPPM